MAEKNDVAYKEDAVDGDKDGLVQDGTDFERPTESNTKAAKAKKEVVEVVQPEWFAELQAATVNYEEEGDEPQAVIRARLNV